MSEVRPRPATHRRPVRSLRHLLLLVALVAALVTGLSACPSNPGGSSVSFQTELQDAEAMIAQASTIAAVDVEPTHKNSSGGNLAGAPDPSTELRNISVQWESTEPPPFAAIRDLWTGTFGFEVTSESPTDVFLSKGEMRASIGMGGVAADGRRNVFFGVTTGLHPADEVPDPD